MMIGAEWQAYPMFPRSSSWGALVLVGMLSAGCESLIENNIFLIQCSTECEAPQVCDERMGLCRDVCVHDFDCDDGLLCEASTGMCLSRNELNPALACDDFDICTVDDRLQPGPDDEQICRGDPKCEVGQVCNRTSGLCSDAPEMTETDCDDNFDNDGDQLVDCLDPECSLDESCEGLIACSETQPCPQGNDCVSFNCVSGFCETEYHLAASCSIPCVINEGSGTCNNQGDCLQGETFEYTEDVCGFDPTTECVTNLQCAVNEDGSPGCLANFSSGNACADGAGVCNGQGGCELTVGARCDNVSSGSSCASGLSCVQGWGESSAYCVSTGTCPYELDGVGAITEISNGDSRCGNTGSNAVKSRTCVDGQWEAKRCDVSMCSAECDVDSDGSAVAFAECSGPPNERVSERSSSSVCDTQTCVWEPEGETVSERCFDLGYDCNTATGLCLTTCSEPLHCISGFECVGNQCCEQGTCS